MSILKKLISTPPPTFSQEDGSKLSPMERAKATWDRREGHIILQNYNLRRICIVLSIAILVLTTGLVIQSLKSSVTPYIVEVDSTTGEVKNVGLVQTSQNQVPNEAVTKYFLGQFIKDIREVPLDIVVYKQNVNKAYAFLTKDAANKMNAAMKDDERIANIGKQTVQVKIGVIQPVAGSPETWSVRWTEEIYNIGSSKKSIVNMSAIVSTAIKTPDNQATAEVNPLGIYIRDFNWDRESSHSVEEQNK